MNNKYWEEEIETMPREQLRELQLQRLKKTVSIAANSPYYKKVFQEHGITNDLLQRTQKVHHAAIAVMVIKRQCMIHYI